MPEKTIEEYLSLIIALTELISSVEKFEKETNEENLKRMLSAKEMAKKTLKELGI